MNIKQLIADLPIDSVSRLKDYRILGISSHSQSVGPGYLFLSKQGATPEGLRHIDQAIAAGAVVILAKERAPFVPEGVCQLYAHDLDAAEMMLAQRFFLFPQLKLCGITGTNGKTTVSYLVKHLLECAGYRVGVIGTIAYLIGHIHLNAHLTTPDLITNYRLLSEMERAGCTYGVLETSSHGLVQGRLRGLRFQAGIFTNLTQDHLDYHKTMQAYAEAKQLLFKSLYPNSIAIVNEQSAYSSFMLQGCVATPLSYGLSPDADLWASHCQFLPNQTQMDIHYKDHQLRVTSPLVGDFNVLNVLAAFAFCLSEGCDLTFLSHALTSFEGVLGRMEQVENTKGLHLYVDFAHTPDALRQVCKTLRLCCQGRLIVVFGAGGDRDHLKRPQMGEVVHQCADYAVITSDNPRSEDPHTICQEIALGMGGKNYEIVINRKEAIACALQRAKAGDTILVAGKGHETHQIFAHKTMPFDDREVLKELVEGTLCY